MPQIVHATDIGKGLNILATKLEPNLGDGLEFLGLAMRVKLGTNLSFGASGEINAAAGGGGGTATVFGDGIETTLGVTSVDLAAGLAFDAGGAIEPSLGKGLTINGSDIEASLGAGLKFNASDQARVDTGAGLGFNAGLQVEIQVPSLPVVATKANGDYIPIYDISGALLGRITVANLLATNATVTDLAGNVTLRGFI